MRPPSQGSVLPTSLFKLLSVQVPQLSEEGLLSQMLREAECARREKEEELGSVVGETRGYSGEGEEVLVDGEF